LSDDLQPITVLVVDDEKVIRDLLGETLGALGYITVTCKDYQEANNVLEKQHIDLIITDIFLRDKTGFDLIEQAKKDYPQIPVLVISGKQYSKQAVMTAGADGFLSKPFRIGVVEDMIQKTLLRQDMDKVKLRPHRKKILVVDDEPDVVSTLIESLEALGYQADGAENGVIALKLLKKSKYDLVITDIRMPEKNGIDLMKDIQIAYPDVLVVIITGYTMAYPPEQAFREGADGYIAKPFRINQIDELLAKLLYNFSTSDKS